MRTPRLGTRLEVKTLNLIASACRYVVERIQPYSVPLMMRDDAVRESFLHAKEKMMTAFSFLDRFEGLSLSIDLAKERFPNRKTVLEFGVFKGHMINYQAKKFPELNFVGFDSFEGLKETWGGMLSKGAFNLEGRLPKVRKNVSLVSGWFDKSFSGWKQKAGLEAPLLIHVDCDTYDSTVDVLNCCSSYVTHGIFFHFDDYFGYQNWKNGGYKALCEISASRNWAIDYISYGTKEVSIFVREGN